MECCVQYLDGKILLNPQQPFKGGCDYFVHFKGKERKNKRLNEWTLGTWLENWRKQSWNASWPGATEENKSVLSSFFSLPPPPPAQGFSWSSAPLGAFLLKHYQHIGGNWKHVIGWDHQGNMQRRRKRALGTNPSYRDGDAFPGLGWVESRPHRGNFSLVTILELNLRGWEVCHLESMETSVWSKGNSICKSI